MRDIIEYPGEELDLFAHAENWKAYWAAKVQPYISGDVLEVGAGLGVNTRLLLNPQAKSWTCLEPDPALCSKLREELTGNVDTSFCRSITGTLDSLPSGSAFDSVIYIDVLEHIEHDVEELSRASAVLRPGGFIVVLSPAHQFLYSPFDKSIGHFRRYNRASLRACLPSGCTLEQMFYLDSVALFASLANRVLLKQSMPSLKQILFWDRNIVPVSRTVDGLAGYRLGKSIVGIWRKSVA